MVVQSSFSNVCFQAVMLEKFISVVLELQTEIKSVGRINASLVDSNRQFEELNKAHDVQLSKSRACNKVQCNKISVYEVWIHAVLSAIWLKHVCVLKCFLLQMNNIPLCISSKIECLKCYDVFFNCRVQFVWCFLLFGLVLMIQFSCRQDSD